MKNHDALHLYASTSIFCLLQFMQFNSEGTLFKNIFEHFSLFSTNAMHQLLVLQHVNKL